jgi:hypothetical protein
MDKSEQNMPGERRSPGERVKKQIAIGEHTMLNMAGRMAFAVLVVSFAAACGGGGQQSKGGAGHEAATGAGDLKSFVAEMRDTRFDYQPADTPAALADQADAVFTGTIVAVRPGQSYAPTPASQPELATSVLEVRVDRFLGGDAGVVNEGSVYVEVSHPALVAKEPEGELVPFDQSAFAEAVPRAYGVFFVDDRTKEPYWDTIIDEGAGRPVGARLTTPFVQGFLIEDAEGRLVSAMEPVEDMPEAWKGLSSVDDVLAKTFASQ